MPIFLEEITDGRELKSNLKQSGTLWTQVDENTRSYLILSDTLDDTEDTIITTTGVPELYEVLNGRTCISLEGKELDRVASHPVTGVPCALWNVKAKFSNEIPEGGSSGGGAGTNPTDLDPVYEWDSETIMEIVEKDQDGLPYVTAAKEAIITEEPRTLPVLIISYYVEAPFEPLITLEWTDVTNSTEYRGAPVGTALVRKIRSVEETHNGVKYCKVTWHIAFNIKTDPANDPAWLAHTWKRKILHQGYKYFDGTGKVKIALVNGEPTKVNLNADGTLRDKDLNPLSLTFRNKRYKDFSLITEIN